MLIAFIGDVHGCVFDALAAVLTLQRKQDRPFDLVVQVGDMGAYPEPERTDASTAAYIAIDHRQSDFARLLRADDSLAAALRRSRAELPGPIHFLRGNHEDFAYLSGLDVDPETRTASVDDHDVLRYVPDGHVMDLDGVRVGFLGGVEELTGPPGFDGERFDEFRSFAPGTIDILVTHEGPYGSSTGYRGDIHGSRMITELLESLRPPFLVAGHAHQLSGPAKYADTMYLGLDGLVPSRRWYPDARGLNSGCLGVLDTERGTLEPVADDWLSEFETPFDLRDWADEFLAPTGPSLA